MANNNKETERAELHKTIWRIANDLRGSVDGWDFKTYVLGMLFYRFISENLASYLNEQERKAGSPDFDYARLSDADAEFGRAETVKEKGFYILPSELFASVRARARHDANLNETLSNIFADIEGSATGSDSENDIKGLFDDLDVNSSKLGPTVAKRNEKLVKLLDAIGDLPLASSEGGFTKNTIDLFGDAYEYLMQMHRAFELHDHVAPKQTLQTGLRQKVRQLLAIGHHAPFDFPDGAPPRSHGGLDLRLQCRGDLFVRVEKEDVVAGGVRQQAVALHGKALPVGVDEGLCAQATGHRHRVIRAAAVHHDHFIGKRRTAQAATDLVGLVLGQHGDREGRRGGR
jgi:hypothetical protein